MLSGVFSGGLATADPAKTAAHDTSMMVPKVMRRMRGPPSTAGASTRPDSLTPEPSCKTSSEAGRDVLDVGSPPVVLSAKPLSDRVSECPVWWRGPASGQERRPACQRADWLPRLSPASARLVSLERRDPGHAFLKTTFHGS